MAVLPTAASFNTLVVASGAVPQTLTANVTSTGDNRLLVVQVTWYPETGNTVLDEGGYLESVTYGGVAMTLVSENFAGGKSNSIYYKIAPNTASTAIVATFNGVDTLSMTASLGAVRCSGAHQTTPIAQSGVATGISGTITKTLTTASVNNLLIDGALLDRGGGTSVPTKHASQTLQISSLVGTGASRHYELMSTKAATGGSDTMSWTQTGAAAWATIVLELAAAAAEVPVGASPTQIMFGGV